MKIQFMISLLSLCFFFGEFSTKRKMENDILTASMPLLAVARIKNPTHTLRPFFFEKHSRQDVCSTDFFVLTLTKKTF